MQDTNRKDRYSEIVLIDDRPKPEPWNPSWPYAFCAFVVAIFLWLGMGELVIHTPGILRELYRVNDLLVRLW